MNLEGLIERWRAGDQRAAESVCNVHKEQTFRLAYALLGNSEDAEEATRDALTYALLNIRHFDKRRSKFTTWLQNRRSPLDSRPGPEQRVTENENCKSVWDAIQVLSPDLREAATLRYWGGLNYQEIAEITGCTMKTAQSRVRLAHQKLVRSLGDVDFHQSAEEAR